MNQYAVTKALYDADSVERLCEVAVKEIRGLSGFDRVMIYRFDADAHGCVVAEARAADAEPFLGLNYPATDIPRQARVLYLRNWIRVIPDVDYRADPLLALPETGGADRIDLSMAVLRSVSPYHLKYLQNMGVAATLTISIVIDSQLWGLIACHHDAPRRVGHLERLAYEALGQQLAVRLKAAELAGVHSRVQTLSRISAQVITAMASADNTAQGAASAKESLLAMVDADGVVLEIEGERISAGEALSSPCLDALLPWLVGRGGAGPQPWRTESLAAESGLPIAPGECPATAAGLMYLPLPGHARNFIAWFRGERAQTVRWAGAWTCPRTRRWSHCSRARPSRNGWSRCATAACPGAPRRSRRRRNWPRPCRRCSCTGRRTASRGSLCMIRSRACPTASICSTSWRQRSIPANPIPGAGRAASACSSSTSTASRASTTPTATRAATNC